MQMDFNFMQSDFNCMERDFNCMGTPTAACMEGPQPFGERLQQFAEGLHSLARRLHVGVQKWSRTEVSSVWPYVSNVVLVVPWSFRRGIDVHGPPADCDPVRLVDVAEHVEAGLKSGGQLRGQFPGGQWRHFGVWLASSSQLYGHSRQGGRGVCQRISMWSETPTTLKQYNLPLTQN